MSEEQQQGIYVSYEDLMKFLDMAPKGNPLTAGLLQGGSTLASILSDILGPKSPQEKMLEWQLEERKRLMPKLQNLPEGYSEGDVLKHQSLTNRRLSPIFDKIAFNYGRGGGRGSPQTMRNTGIDLSSILADSELDIRKYFENLGEQRRRFKYGTMAGII